MTDPVPDDGAGNVGDEVRLELDWRSLMEVVNAGVSRTVFWQAAELLDDDGLLDDDEIDALNRMPLRYKQTVAAQLLDYAESIREGSRRLDTQLMRLTGELV